MTGPLVLVIVGAAVSAVMVIGFGFYLSAYRRRAIG